MKRALLLLSAVAALTACDARPVPGESEPTGVSPIRFEQGGRPYQWNIAGVSGRAGLFLTRLDRADGGPVVLTLSCTDSGHGGLSLAMGERRDGPLAMQAGSETFVVDAVRKEHNGHVRAAGEGSFPDRWPEALGAADQVVVTHGPETLTFPGPGAPLMRRFADFCGGRR